MHGLICSSALLGWTRLLDEWVVGLTAFNRVSVDSPTCWEDPDKTRATLVSAVRRVTSFALTEADTDPVAIDSTGCFHFELQGQLYRVATAQLSPATGDDLARRVAKALDAAADAAGATADEGVLVVGALFVTPALEPSLGAEERARHVAEILDETRGAGSSGCAFSFPRSDEMLRYHYVNDAHPGAILTVKATTGASPIST
ncbi:MAG: hypothetical protein AAGF92_10170 [Myxococcota bacterium]